jgi:hypothetical protein
VLDSCRNACGAQLGPVGGAAIAAAQIFETEFVLGAGLALTQSHVDVLEDIEPISEAKSFKKPVRKTLLLGLVALRRLQRPGHNCGDGEMRNQGHEAERRRAFFGVPSLYKARRVRSLRR